jgi:hypothetical protein
MSVANADNGTTRTSDTVVMNFASMNPPEICSSYGISSEGEGERGEFSIFSL